MKRLNKKGFTLVELLAVIVVLAIIMLVVADRVGDAMKQSRGDSLLLQVKSMEREINKICILNNEITEVEIRATLAGSGLEYNDDAESGDVSFTATAKQGSKFANIIIPKNSESVIETGTEKEPVVTINTSCPIVAGSSS